MAGKTPMTKADSARIQSTQAKANNSTAKGSFPARAQAAAANNVNKGVVPAKGASSTSTGGAKAQGGSKPAKK